MVGPGERTDFWQRTHYGFRADNGHLQYAEVYDQAGLIARFSSECWLKTSVEFEPSGPSQLGVVVTNGGYSDWSLQDFPHDGLLNYRLRIRREGRDFLVEYADDETGPWRLLRMAHLNAEPETGALAGFYACSPKGSGYRAGASLLRIDLP